MIQINPQDGVPIYRQIIDQVRLLVMSGRLAPGDQLESVKSLATRLKVNPMTISKAYGYLVEEGLAERRRGVGLFVSTQADDEQEKGKETILAEALAKDAVLAVQLGVGKTRAMQILGDEMSALTDKQRSGRHDR